MSEKIPERCPECVLALLSRPEWYPKPEVLREARLAYATGLPRLLSSEFFSGGKMAAITLGKTIYFRNEDLYNPHTIAGLSLLAHELKHVEQYLNDKLFKFYVNYLQDYARFKYGKSIRYEAEAYTLGNAVKKAIDEGIPIQPAAQGMYGRRRAYPQPGIHQAAHRACLGIAGANQAGTNGDSFELTERIIWAVVKGVSIR